MTTNYPNTNIKFFYILKCFASAEVTNINKYWDMFNSFFTVFFKKYVFPEFVLNQRL